MNNVILTIRKETSKETKTIESNKRDTTKKPVIPCNKVIAFESGILHKNRPRSG